MLYRVGVKCRAILTLFVKRFFGGNIWEQMCYWMRYSSYIHVMLNKQHKTESEQFSKEWWCSFTEMFSGTPVLSRMRLEALFPPLYYFGLTTLTTLTVIYHLAPSDQSGWGSVFFFFSWFDGSSATRFISKWKAYQFPTHLVS